MWKCFHRVTESWHCVESEWLVMLYTCCIFIVDFVLYCNIIHVHVY